MSLNIKNLLVKKPIIVIAILALFPTFTLAQSSCVRFVLEQPEGVMIPRMLAVPTNQPV